MLAAALYNIVDQIFIANADYLGSYGNAANTVFFPMTILAIALAVMIGDGCYTFVSIHLGSGSLFRHLFRSHFNATPSEIRKDKNILPK